MMTLMSGKPTLHIMISILSILVFLIFLWMFDFFVPKNISCVFLISPEKYFAFFAFCRWRSLNWKRRRGESLLNWQQRRLLGGSPLDPRSAVRCSTRRHQVKAKKEACNGDEEEESWRICYANLTSCKFVSQLGRPTAVSIPPPHPPFPVPSMHCSAYTSC